MSGIPGFDEIDQSFRDAADVKSASNVGSSEVGKDAIAAQGSQRDGGPAQEGGDQEVRRMMKITAIDPTGTSAADTEMNSTSRVAKRLLESVNVADGTSLEPAAVKKARHSLANEQATSATGPTSGTLQTDLADGRRSAPSGLPPPIMYPGAPARPPDNHGLSMSLPPPPPWRRIFAPHATQLNSFTTEDHQRLGGLYDQLDGMSMETAQILGIGHVLRLAQEVCNLSRRQISSALAYIRSTPSPRTTSQQASPSTPVVARQPGTG
ncbi:hypothetical protein LTR53_018110, partial [Teratosphaeriaceae sp. CCFEE 6253]